MDCEEVENDEIAEAYVAGRLDESSRDAFEAHFFECEACFERLEACRALAQSLVGRRAKRGSMPRLVRLGAWPVGLAAAAALVVAVVQMPMHSSPSLPSGGAAGPPTPAAATLAVLGQFEPPPYSPVNWRDGTSEEQQRFQAAMKHYLATDYERAIPDLRRAVAASPTAAQAHFFLGICLLLARDTDGGIASLERTSELGDTPYLESALFYLAKGYLRRSDSAQAERSLLRVVALHGDLESSAQSLLRQIAASASPRP
jgi:TolA-binding protein